MKLVICRVNGATVECRLVNDKDIEATYSDLLGRWSSSHLSFETINLSGGVKGNIPDLLIDVESSYQDEGCDGCGTISESVIKKIRQIIG